jgi:WD40 repeat protein
MMPAPGMLRPLLLLLLYGLLTVTVAAQPKPSLILTTECSSDGKYLALGGEDSAVWIYATDNFSILRSFQVGSAVKCIAWHPKEDLLAVATIDGLQLLQVETGAVTNVPSIRTGGRAVDWNFSGALLAFGDNNGVLTILDKQGKLLRSICKKNNSGYNSIDWHPSQNMLVTGGDDILLFDTSGTQLGAITHRNIMTGVLAVKWHPSGAFFAAGDFGHEKEGIPSLLQFWKANGNLIREIRGKTKSEYRDLRWTKTGSLLATASDELRVWDDSGELQYSSAGAGDPVGVAWFKDDTRLITVSFENARVKIWTDKAALLRTVQ